MLTGTVRLRWRASFIAALLLGISTGLAACGGTEGAGDSSSSAAQPPATHSATVPSPADETPESAADGWVAFTSIDDGFSAEMPAQPETETKSMDSALGELTFYFFQVTEGAAYYAVSYNDYPVDMSAEDLDPDSLLSDAMSSAGGGGEIQNVQRIDVQGHPGIEGEMAVQETTHVWYRGVQVNNRLYQLIVAAPEADKDAFAEDAARFINSFTLLKP